MAIILWLMVNIAHSELSIVITLGDVPVVVYEHDEDATITECMKVEAQLFFELNSLAKKPTKLDEVRAGI